jgi:hypothetical protein
LIDVGIVIKIDDEDFIVRVRLFYQFKAAAATRDRLLPMLPLLSTRMPMETGTSSRRNRRSGCSTPSSKILKRIAER